MERPTESAVRSSLYNWLGFGNLDGKYWFVGREESIALTQCDQLSGWSDYFNLRSEFGLATDFRETWEEAFGRPLATFGTTTWHYQIAFLLALHEQPVTSRAVRTIFSGDPQFSRRFSNHFSGEFLPCPKKSKKTIDPYSHIWDDVDDYKAEVVPGRREVFARELATRDSVDLVVTYSPTFASEIRSVFSANEVEQWPDIAMDPLVLSELIVSDERAVYLLETPFLGYGRIGYDAIETVVSELPPGI